MNSEIIIIFISMLIYIASYIVYSRCNINYFNVLTPSFIITLPSFYILELVYIYFNGSSGSTEAYWCVYLLYTLSPVITVYVLLNIKAPAFFINYIPPYYEVRYAPYVLLILAFCLYLPVLIEFREYLRTPRVIYALTRTGYGLNSFGSAAMANIAFVLFLFKNKAYKIERILFFVFCTSLALLRGSKGQIITYIFIWLLYSVYVQGKHVSLRRFVSFGISFSIAIIVIFYLFSVGIELEAKSMLVLMSNYSDYTRNSIMVVDDDRPPLWGKLTLEDTVYSRIPRALMPSKPKDFGGFYLAKLYFPDRFEGDTGAPAFGIGVTYADFKYLAFIYTSITSFISAFLLKVFIKRTMSYKDPGDFIMLLFFAGIVLIPTGAGYFLPEYFLFGILISIAMRLRIARFDIN